MAEITIESERGLSLAEMDSILDKVKKRDGDLNERSTKVKEYLKVFVKKKLKDTEELKKKLEELNIPRLRERHVVKLVDIMPKDIDSVKAVLSGETLVIKQEDAERIVKVFK